MKINKLHINKYGCIDDKNIEFSGGISIIQGDNESGKSTTHMAMLDLMFGFDNAGRRNSFKLSPKAMPFDGGYPRLEGNISDNSGSYTANRYFEGNTPMVDIDNGGVISRSENISLNVFAGLSRETYQGIYSLDVDQMVRLKDSWEREQDSILAGLQSDILLPNDIVMANLDEKIKTVWKGKSATKLTKAKEVEDDLSDLKLKLQRARQDQNELRQTEDNQERIKSEIHKIKLNLEKMTQEQIELVRQIEFYKEYSEIRDLMIKNSAVEKYSDVPKDIIGYLEDLAEAANEDKRKAEELEERLDDLNQIVNRFKNHTTDIEKYEELFASAEKTALKLDNVKSKIERDSERRTEKKSKILSKVKRLFDNFTWDDFNELMDVNIAGCLAVLDKLKDMNMERSRLQDDAYDNMRLKDRRFFKSLDKLDIVLFVLALIGAAAIFVPFGINKLITVIAGAIIFGASIVGFLSRPKTKDDLDDEYKHHIQKLDDDIYGLNQKLKTQVGFNYIPKERLSKIDQALIEAIAQLQDDYTEYSDIEDEVDTDTVEAAKMEKEIADIAENLLGRNSHYKSDIESMRQNLVELNKIKNDASSAQSQIKVLNDNLLEIKNRIVVTDKKAEDIKNMLFDLEGSSMMEKAQRLNHMRSEYFSAESRFNVQIKKYDDYEKLHKAIGKNIEQKIFSVSSHLEEINELILNIRNEESQLVSEQGRLSEKKKYLEENGLSPAIIEGRIEQLKEEKARRIKMRDEYAIAYGIIQKARDKFLSERSPKFLTTASEYINYITEGKYNKISLSDKGTSIMVSSNKKRNFDFESVDEVLSRGTKEQVYLALRLAMLERFDPNGDKLPIILDEALVNWDKARFKKIIEIMDMLSKDRQVFIYTCHDYVTETIKKTAKNYSLINI